MFFFFCSDDGVVSVVQALIYLESIQSLPKRIDSIDSLVDKYLAPTADDSDAAIILEKEELSSIYLEVTNNYV